MLSKIITSAFAAHCLFLLATAASIHSPPSELRRRDSQPKACELQLGNQGEYGYWDQSGAAGRDVCFGWGQGGLSCGKAWSKDEINDIMSVASQQLAKDGQLKTSTVGRWTAVFGVFTTAFPDPDPVFFDHGIQNVQTLGPETKTSIGAKDWYYQDSQNFMMVSTFTCPKN
ncbi:MAG: hypothetical protein Q9220_006386 [cf. Caloplaca sp. 1 TL-2023]